MPAHVAKTRTPEQVTAWLTYTVCVRQATSIDNLIELTEELSLTDKGQASFAYNRAKKAMEELGYFEGPKWYKKGYGPMTNKLRIEFYEILRGVNPEALTILKEALLNEDSHRLKSKKRPLFIPSLEKPSVVAPLANTVDTTTPKSKKYKKNSVLVAAAATPGASDNTSSSSVLTAAAAAAPEVQEEAAKSIKASRLADAMQHASFTLLTKAQQQAVRDDWLALLK